MEEDKKDYQSDLEILQTVRLTIQWREKDAFLYLKIRNSLCETLYAESDAKKVNFRKLFWLRQTLRQLFDDNNVLFTPRVNGEELS